MTARNFEEPLSALDPSGRAFGDGLSPLLSRLDPLPLECDGMARVLSTLLTRDDVPHQLAIGSLSVNGVGTIDLHWWIELSDGRVCDLRARMWLGTEDGVPHGCFVPGGQQNYEARDVLCPQVLHPGVFAILAGATMDSFPAWAK